jgi:hypothetical protein
MGISDVGEQDRFFPVVDLTVGDDHDPVNHPRHYTSHPSGVECIEITRHYGFSIGNAIKYLWRNGLKGDESTGVEDLRKSVWYIQDEIARRERVARDVTSR